MQLSPFFVMHIKIAVLQNSGAFSEAFSWKRLKMAIYKLYIPILESSQWRIETIFRSIGLAVQDLADFSFIFSHIWIAYISRTKPFMKNYFNKFLGLKISNEPVKFCENQIRSFREKRVTDGLTNWRTDNHHYSSLPSFGWPISEFLSLIV